MVPKNLRPLVPYLKRHRGGLLWGGLCVLCNNGVWILFPQVLRRAVNDLHAGVTRQKLFTYALLVIAIALIKGIFQFLTRWVVIGISRDIEFDLRNDLFATWSASPIPTTSATAPATSWPAPPTI